MGYRIGAIIQDTLPNGTVYNRRQTAAELQGLQPNPYGFNPYMPQAGQYNPYMPPSNPYAPYGTPPPNPYAYTPTPYGYTDPYSMAYAASPYGYPVNPYGY